MKKLEVNDLLNLVWGNRVWRFDGHRVRGLYFVGKDPRSERTLIFCDGSYITSIYINQKDNSFPGEWFDGEYDSTKVGELIISELTKEIELVKSVYIDPYEKINNYQALQDQ